MEKFTNLYQVSKTLRFELIPIGKTKENIEQKGILERDNNRAISYKTIKKVIDEYHKEFIEQKLNAFKFKMIEYDGEHIDPLDIFNSLYHSTGQNRKKSIVRVQDALRKQISEHFTNSHEYKKLFGKELITEDLVQFVTTPMFEKYLKTKKGNENLNDDEIHKIKDNIVQEISNFKGFTTYFSGFFENRKNMYVADDKATSIANRLIMENLPKFIDNMDVFEEISASDVSLHFDTLYKEMEEYLNVNSIEELFQLDYFSDVLTQKQIDVYNAIIGGKTLEDGTKIKGLNEYVNLYNQQQKERSNRLPKLKSLFKQILSERNAISWLPEEFANDNEMLDCIEQCYQNLKENVFEGANSLKDLLRGIGEFDTEHIYLPDDLQLTNILQKQYENWGVIKTAFKEFIMNENPKKRNETIEKYMIRIEKLLKSNECFSLAQINLLIRNYIGEEFTPIETYFANMGAENTENGQKPNIFIRIDKAHTDALTLLTTPYPTDKNLSQDKENVEKIKTLLDAIKELQHFVKPLLGNGIESERDSRFYGELTPHWEMLNQITPIYNMVRNRMTKKVYSDEKIKLFFDNNGTFLNGWVDTKTENSDNGTQYGGYLFRKQNSIGEYDYYLGVSAATKLFRSFNLVKPDDKSSFERLDYYQLKGKTFYGSLYKGDYEEESANIIRAIDNVVESEGCKNLKEKISDEKEKKQPKVSTAIGYLNFVKQADNELYEKLLQNDLFKKGNQAIISSIKKTLQSLDRIPSAKEYAQKTYSLFSEMMDDVEIMLKGKVFSYFPISQRELDEAVDRTTKPLYLFKITNKDLSYAETYEKGQRKSRGIDNLHTMYFKALMNGNQSVLDIGSGTMFFRERKIIYTKEQLQKGHHYEMLKDKFNYPIISKKRYAFDKFQFHLSVTMNYNSDKSIDLNPMVNAYLKDSNATHIIGIDRGERHLLYLSLIDLQGNIVEQYSLNEIVNEYNGKTYTTNYRNLLDAKEKQRDEARRSWQTIENIKDLKEGYMSQVVHKIASLMMKYNAIVVLEDLNIGFMRGRQKVEKQVYQKFEKMLIDKLNYLVDKKQKYEDLGGVLNAYQLTNKFVSFQKLGKQSGFLFYIPAWNTSKMDPTTGFVNLFDTRYVNIDKSIDFFKKFQSISYNKTKDWFEFTFDYDTFTTKATGTKTQWTICTYGNRIETKREPQQNNMFVSKEYNLTKEFKNLFTTKGLDIKGDLKEQICKQNESDFLKKILHLLHLTLQMRNSITGTDVDYLISPVMNANGNFYDSRKCGKNLPENADANGAYNIARKGLWVIEQIKQSNDLSKLKLAISNKEWLNYAQNELYLNN